MRTVERPVVQVSVDDGGNLHRSVPADERRLVHELRLFGDAEVLEDGENASGFQHLVIRDAARHIYVVVVPDAPVLAADVEAAQREAVVTLRAYGSPRVVRTWNYVGRINQPNHAGLERYRDFCVGRDQAYSGTGLLRSQPPAATGVGVASGGVTSILVAEGPEVRVQTVENRFQVPAFRYPRLYGPASPSFSRALLRYDGVSEITYVSGTASIVGHRSTGDTLLVQLDGTTRNLAEVARAARQHARRPDGRWQEVKAYVRRHDDLDAVRTELIARLDVAPDAVTAVVADICRTELLVEVEGIYEHVA